MANDNRPDGEAGDPPAGAPAQLSAAGAARRRLARAGIGATGVLLTLTSQPGMAASICTSPSGSLSGGLQSHHGPAPVCNGVSPGFWKTSANTNGLVRAWPPGCTPDTKYGSIFQCLGNNATTYGPATCLTMLSHQDFDVANLGMHLVAAYLNVLSGRTSFLTTETLNSMWDEWQMNSYYTPTAGVQWDAGQIVDYLKGTMS